MTAQVASFESPRGFEHHDKKGAVQNTFCFLGIFKFKQMHRLAVFYQRCSEPFSVQSTIPPLSKSDNLQKLPP